jgi:hypothetical protein
MSPDFSVILSNFNFSTATTTIDSVTSMQGIFELDGDCNVILQGRIGQVRTNKNCCSIITLVDSRRIFILLCPPITSLNTERHCIVVSTATSDLGTPRFEY